MKTFTHLLTRPQNIESRYLTFDYAVTANAALSGEVNLATSFGMQYFTKARLRNYSFGREFPSPELTTVSSGAVRSADETFVENKTFGLFLQERLAWRNRLFVTGAIRGDDNSAFGKDYDFVVYPKLSGSWMLSEEPFWNVPWVNELRVRAAWGRAGQQPDAYAAIRTFSPKVAANDAPGFVPNNPGNPELKPEVGEELELGFDAGVWDGCMDVSVNYYVQKKKDAIVLRAVPPSTGFPGGQYLNVGEISVWGLELELDARPVQSPSIGVELSATAAYNTNEITRLGGPTLVVGGFQTIQHREGFPLGSFFSKRVVQATKTPDGRFQNVLCDGGRGKLRPGGPAVPCDQAPELFLGQPGPKWQGSVNARVTLWGNLRLYASSDFRLGQYMFNVTTFGRDAVFRNSYLVNKPGAWAPELEAENRLGFRGQWVENHSFVAFREVAAAYTLPARLASGLFKASRASVRVAARQLGYFWVHPDFADLDPDVQPLGNTAVRSQQTLTPTPMSFVASLNVTF